jgi:2'-5' RNA ligase
MSVRAFIALVPSVAVTRRIAEEAARRKPAFAEAGLRVAWVPAANLHVTLHFLGSVPEESLEAVAGRLRQIGERVPPIELRARGLGAFPSPDKPRILWAGADGGEPLRRLQREVEAGMVGLGFIKDEREYHPHVTVGRVKEGAAAIEVAWSSEIDFGVSTVAEVVVYESRTLRTGSEYLARARVPLTGAKETPARDIPRDIPRDTQRDTKET